MVMGICGLSNRLRMGLIRVCCIYSRVNVWEEMGLKRGQMGKATIYCEAEAMTFSKVIWMGWHLSIWWFVCYTPEKGSGMESEKERTYTDEGKEWQKREGGTYKQCGRCTFQQQNVFLHDARWIWKQSPADLGSFNYYYYFEQKIHFQWWGTVLKM